MVPDLDASLIQLRDTLKRAQEQVLKAKADRQLLGDPATAEEN